MSDLIKENFLKILQSLEMIKKRFDTIKTPDDFELSNEGVTLLDSISMRLQVVGELLKKIDKHDNTFLNQYPSIEWQQIMRLRDIISHHYDSIDNEIVFDICTNHITKLETVIREVLN